MTGEDRVGGPYLLVMAGAAVGVCALMLRLPLWVGSGLMGVAILGGALVRLLGARSGDLAVRAKGIDVLLLTGLGVALVLSGVLMVLW